MLKGIPAPIILNPSSNFLGLTIDCGHAQAAEVSIDFSCSMVLLDRQDSRATFFGRMDVRWLVEGFSQSEFHLFLLELCRRRVAEQVRDCQSS